MARQTAARTTDRQTGIVRWFSDSKGYGFITADDPSAVPPKQGRSSADLFVHYTGIQQEGHGRRTLEEGQRVEFSIEQGEKGPAAVDVLAIEE